MKKIEIVDLYALGWSDSWGEYINIEVEFPNGKTETIARSIKTTYDDYEDNYNKALNVAHALGYYLSGELN